jgi:hypothetical protein
MTKQVVNGAILQCNQGTLPSPLTVTSNSKVWVQGQKAATINDHGSESIKSFGLCHSPSNPAFAASGIPQPCKPTVIAPWTPPCMKSIIMGQPALASNGKCICIYAGEISVLSPSNVKVDVS